MRYEQTNNKIRTIWVETNNLQQNLDKHSYSKEIIRSTYLNKKILTYVSDWLEYIQGRYPYFGSYSP